MRISDWSSDVCSSDLLAGEHQPALALVRHLVAVLVAAEEERDEGLAGDVGALVGGFADQVGDLLHRHADLELGELAIGCRNTRDLALDRKSTRLNSSN